MPVINRIAAMADEITAWRRDIHAHPELGFAETRTSALIADKLRGFGVDEVVTGMAKTGVVGVLHGQRGTEAIGLRADIDALPIVEESGAPWASTHPGVMHACGHDGHTAMLLGAAKYLAETRNFAGTVYLIFQPAEEGGGGGRVMVEEGLFDRFPMQRVFGLHNWPSLPAGRFVWRDGPIMAAVGDIEITVRGRGAHGAYPHQGADPIVAACAIVGALQSVVARNVDPMANAVVTIGHIEAGRATNVIPETARMIGTVRWLTPEVGDLLETRIRAVAAHTAEAYGLTADVVFNRNYPVTVNDPEANTLARRAMATVAGEAQVTEAPQATMGGEDFSFMLDAKGGAYVLLGGGRSKDDPQVHHPRYDFNDDILPVGASYWATLTEQVLARE